jgi:multidrug efflux pump subunit AcrB
LPANVRSSDERLVVDMGFVRFALRRPYTFFVLGIVIVLGGIATIRRTPTDVLPNIDIPVVTVVWFYDGLTGEETERRITTYSEYSLSFFVDNIRTIESQTLPGLVIEKLYFQPTAKVEMAMSQVVSATSSIRALLPVGIQPPIIMQFTASSVPVLRLSLSSDSLSETQLYDYGLYRVRQQLAPVQGVTLPSPYGGRQRQIMVDLDSAALIARGVTPTDVMTAINAQSVTLPSGQMKLGTQQYEVKLNAMPPSISLLNEVPIRQMGNATIKVKDVGQVRDGSAVQTNIVRTSGRRSVMLTILKRGDASTLDVVDRIRNDILPITRSAAPKGMKIDEFFDQSLFVRAAIRGVVTEAGIAALLTVVMILTFLASWRSTLVVFVSIPLAILSSILALSAIGQTLNVMTLGGLALAVGILVDDATVTIENIHRLKESGDPLPKATLYGAAGIAVPTLLSTLAICLVFISVEFLVGPSKFLFTPMALAVIFAMLASYLLSRTLVPIFAGMLLKHEPDRKRRCQKHLGAFARFGNWFDGHFDNFRERYVGLLNRLLRSALIVPIVVLAVACSAGILFSFTGRDFFPSVDAGIFRLHVRAPSGTRLEMTEKIFDQVESVIKDVIPENEREMVLDNIGVPFRYNMPFDDGSTVGRFDGQILVALSHEHHATENYIRRLRRELAVRFPEVTFYFQPGDIITQILNFGIPAQIDVQVSGYDLVHNLEIARGMERELRAIPGVADAHIHQVLDQPRFDLTVDRDRAQQLGMTATDVATDVMVALASSLTTQPNFWVDPKTGIPYPLAVQLPEYRLQSLDDLRNTAVAPHTGPPSAAPSLLGNVGGLARSSAQSVFSHSNIQPTFNIYANVEGRDLGGVARDIERVIARYRPKLSAGNDISVLGQIESMKSAFSHMGTGLIVAAIAVYLLMVINFQSFKDPFVVMIGLIGAMSGIVLILFATGTTVSVPALMGAIMAVGVASANSILLVTFAKEQRADGRSAFDAAIAAGQTRLRPILMTALAMIIGMLPMSLGLGEGGEQNAPLGRAVIGGLLFGTLSTLFLVPWLYSRLRKHEAPPSTEYDHV